MNKTWLLKRFGAVAVGVGVVGGMAASADAAAWYGTDATQEYELTAGTTYRQTGSGPVETCMDSRLRLRFTGPAASPILGGPTIPGPWADMARFQMTFDGCSLLATGTKFNFTCTDLKNPNAGRVFGASTTGTGTATAPAFGGSTVVALSGIHCEFRTGAVAGSGTLCSTMTGGISVGTAPNQTRYNNPTSASTNGSFTFAVSSESLTSTTPVVQCLGYTNGPLRFATNSGFTGNVVYTMASRRSLTTPPGPWVPSPGLPLIWQG